MIRVMRLAPLPSLRWTGVVSVAARVETIEDAFAEITTRRLVETDCQFWIAEE